MFCCTHVHKVARITEHINKHISCAHETQAATRSEGSALFAAEGLRWGLHDAGPALFSFSWACAGPPAQGEGGPADREAAWGAKACWRLVSDVFCSFFCSEGYWT